MKIDNDKRWPFYCAYHDDRYIEYHGFKNKIVLKEKREKSKYHLYNDSKSDIIIYKVDGGMITSNKIKKCDYGVYTEQDVLYLIELKGSDYNQALEQIQSTIDNLIKKSSINVKQINVRIILSKYRTPNILYTQEKKLNILLKTKYGKGNIRKQSQMFEEHI